MFEVDQDEQRAVEFPLICVEIKKYKKLYQDALWEGNDIEAEKYKNKIKSLIVMEELGEKYVVPF